MPIHPNAVVDPAASVHEAAEIGPYAIVGARVTIGARTVVGAHAVLEGPTTLGEDNRVSALAALGGPPQDLKYKGEPTTLVIGNRNMFREFCTIHRGTVTGHGTTIIGDDNLFMAYSHVAHDCVVGSRTVFANGASLAGHCVIGDDVVLGAYAAVRQFLRVGPYAFVGAFSGMNHDVLPFLWSSSERDVRAWKVNSVGLQRKGFSAERVAALQKAYRILHRHRHDRAAMMAALEPVASLSAELANGVVLAVLGLGATFWRDVVTVMVPPPASGPMASVALTNRLMNTCCIWLASTVSAGTSAPSSLTSRT